jgi:D-alanine-D-alanine ligase
MAAWKAEYDVMAALQNLGHQVRGLGVQTDVKPIRDAWAEFKPHVVFNQLEEFHSVGTYDCYVVSYLELLQQPYTGCNPRGLMLAHDKALMKKLLLYHRLPTPRFQVFPLGRNAKRPKRLEFPILVKSLTEHASLGISQASVVWDDDKLAERVAFIHQSLHTDALAEEYIEGRELYVGVIGNERLQTYPPWELSFTKSSAGVANIATAKVKFDHDYQKRHGIVSGVAKDLPDGLPETLTRLCKRIYRVLSMSGYARVDLRLTAEGKLFVLEANPNPNLEFGEDFAESAEAAGLKYEQLIQRILNLGLRYDAEWKA